MTKTKHYKFPPNPARPSTSANKMPIALVSTHNQRSDLVCFLITHPLNSRPTASCLDRGLSMHAAVEDTWCLGFEVAPIQVSRATAV